ncbi:hypothetical protein BZA05DRAFT_189048 [Tricharina praecox]|uniref:uncharacterized protein n=1 Tax=Tricharina praecox TaxID=43433 RepID=UPI002220A928|nr:uncharacterized protein BZA05DRAFT_189048 [Tricharina praecox]KAI5842836.1 hypothetical protein BZA05DRAFT_189048 [Tricharina praecox]
MSRVASARTRSPQGHRPEAACRRLAGGIPSQPASHPSRHPIPAGHFSPLLSSPLHPPRPSILLSLQRSPSPLFTVLLRVVHLYALCAMYVGMARLRTRGTRESSGPHHTKSQSAAAQDPGPNPVESRWLQVRGYQLWLDCGTVARDSGQARCGTVADARFTIHDSRSTYLGTYRWTTYSVAMAVLPTQG